LTETSEEPGQKRTWTEHFEITGDELKARAEELIKEGNVRRLIIRNEHDRVLLEVPLTAGIAVGGVVTLLNPVAAALGALGAMFAHLKLEIIRAETDEEA
jgi:hypothetical protein